MQEKSFQCANCGFCCGNSNNLAIFEWEKDILLSTANNIKIKIEILPGHKITYKNTDIILYWGLNIKENSENSFSQENKSENQYKFPCPFLAFKDKKSRCNIYEKRPLVCRSFPIFHLGFNSVEEMISIDCPSHTIPFEENEKISKKEFYIRLLNSYGKTFVDAFRLELARVWISDLAEEVLNYLEENNLCLEEKEIGLIELALKLKILSQEEVESEIRFIYSDEILNLISLYKS